MDGWTNGRMNMNGWVDRLWMDGRMGGWMDKWMERWMDGWIDKWMERRTDGWVDKWMDEYERMGRQMMDG